MRTNYLKTSTPLYAFDCQYKAAIAVYAYKLCMYTCIGYAQAC